MNIYGTGACGIQCVLWVPVTMPAAAAPSTVPPPRESNERQELYLRKATRAALRSDMCERHGCVIVSESGDVIATGHNHVSVHVSIHAEMDALRKCHNNKRVDLGSAEMYVVRIGPESLGHRLKLSKPCDVCRAQINKAGVRKVFYSWSHVDYGAYFSQRSHDRYMSE